MASVLSPSDFISQSVRFPPSATFSAPPASAPPPLPFTLREHKLSICVSWGLIAAEICFVPISIYYGLWFGTDLNHGACECICPQGWPRQVLMRRVFAIITSVFGIVSGLEYTLRAWRLTRRSPKFRPSGSRRWAFDATQLTLAAPYTVMTAGLVGLSIPSEPIVRGLALPFALADVMLGACFVCTVIAHRRHWKTPVRLSSTAPGEPCPPFAFVVLEDVVTVDGGCPGFREAARRRWEASPVFRELLLQVTWAWGLSSVLVGAATLAVVANVDEGVAYGMGWGLPSQHATSGALATFYWAKRKLQQERETWAVDHGGDKQMEQ